MLKKLNEVPLYMLAIFLLLFTGLPFLIMVSASFKTQMEFMSSPWSWPDKFSFENYRLLFESEFFRFFYNSVIVSVISVVAVIILAAMASYPLARMKFRLSRPLFILFLVGMMIPIHTTLIPIFLLTKNLGLYDSIWALPGPYIAFALPVSIVIFTQFLKELPKELEESAKMDGCGHFRLFWKILFPLLTPAVATVAIYNFIQIWNEFIFALVLTTSPENATLPLGLREFYGQFSVNVPGIMAALTLGSLPLLLIYLVAQEKIVKGIAAGSVKG
ncbi:carbohydrate ABC transporter permease [Thalassobacillus pellis]|uniref:carbohydrate ABC transporter permease n=1 Tax=Thalassobacillus pellis TaxID=748008 RepID=UPI0019617AE1|nr:carbohydrate ABC transporter permease [Thalassobacillus pellis]MBM7553443.1 raffinose/stachyose/melibiose transport system permease protein [Thalassobacillus pellis]